MQGPGLIRASLAFAFAALMATPADSAGDLLVAPTRVVLDGARGTEVILNNIGAEPATYRISLELRRMQSDGSLADVTPEQADAREKAILDMISYAPRKVVLAPNQPQSIRIGIRAPEGLADGEYRAHMLFRAIPDAKPVVATATARDGVSIALTPIYGVTIPIIVRQGSLSATASLTNAHVERAPVAGEADGANFVVSLNRTGTRSTYGRIRVSRPGEGTPLAEWRGIAVYAEIAQRDVRLPLTPTVAAALTGPVLVQYLEDSDAGGGLIAELRTQLR